MKQLLFGMLAGVLILLVGLPSEANANKWSMEITPYAWLSGIDADITVGDRTGSVDVKFDDLVDYVDFAGGLLFTVEKNRWVGWFQGDYMSLDSDKEKTDFDQLGTLETEMMILEAAFGYRFNNPLSKEGRVDVLVGGRYTKIENTFDTARGNTFERDNDLADPMLVLRP